MTLAFMETAPIAQIVSIVTGVVMPMAQGVLA